MRSLNDLYDQGRDVLPGFLVKIAQVARATHGEAKLCKELKGRERAEMKARYKYRDTVPGSADTRASGDGIAWYRLTDLVRSTVAYDTIEAMYDGLKSIIDGAHADLDVQELNDRFQNPMPGEGESLYRASPTPWRASEAR